VNITAIAQGHSQPCLLANFGLVVDILRVRVVHSVGIVISLFESSLPVITIPTCLYLASNPIVLKQHLNIGRDSQLKLS